MACEIYTKFNNPAAFIMDFNEAKKCLQNKLYHIFIPLSVVTQAHVCCLPSWSKI